MRENNITPPKFTLLDIKHADGPATFERAQDLWKRGKVRALTQQGDSYHATVIGTKPYDVIITSRYIDRGHCTCYLGENDYLCKHMLAVALAVLDMTGGLTRKEPLVELAAVKKSVADGMRKLCAYNGPSSTWFAYQRSLSTGAGMITEAITKLPPSQKNAEYLWSLVVRLSKKLATGGIDDSDGTVGECVYVLVGKLGEYTHMQPGLLEAVRRFCTDDTGFGFEDELRTLLMSQG